MLGVGVLVWCAGLTIGYTGVRAGWLPGLNHQAASEVGRLLLQRTSLDKGGERDQVGWSEQHDS